MELGIVKIEEAGIAGDAGRDDRELRAVGIERDIAGLTASGQGGQCVAGRTERLGSGVAVLASAPARWGVMAISRLGMKPYKR